MPRLATLYLPPYLVTWSHAPLAALLSAPASACGRSQESVQATLLCARACSAARLTFRGWQWLVWQGCAIVCAPESLHLGNLPFYVYIINGIRAQPLQLRARARSLGASTEEGDPRRVPRALVQRWLAARFRERPGMPFALLCAHMRK